MVGTSYIGRTLGRYKIGPVVGRGGFATVYRAVDGQLERQVALKVVDPNAHHNPTVARRFVREGQTAASLDHPAVVPVYDAGEQDGVLWLAMRLIEGGSLDDALRAGRRLTADQIVAVVRRIGDALDHAHARDLVHRDVKPSNILLEDNDPYRAWLADFGIASTTRSAGLYTTGALGTAAYMAPEQSRPAGAGPPADIYSLACVAYEMVMGRRPFPGEDYVALLLAHANEPVPVTGRAAFDALMARALAKDPGARPPSGAALARELQAALVADGCGPDSRPAAEANGAAPTRAEGADGPDASPPGPAPTIVEVRHDTLLHPVVHPPAAPVVVPMSPVGGIQAAFVPPARPRNRLGIAVGVVVLVIATAATAAGAYAFEQARHRDDPQHITDSQGIAYQVPAGWDTRREQPVTEWADDGQVVARFANYGADGSTDAAELLTLIDPSLCDDDPEQLSGVAGADDAARCTNSPGSETGVLVAVGAVAHDQLWVVTLAPTTTESEQRTVVDSITLAG